MLIKLTIPFILAATVFSASVPVQERRHVLSDLDLSACASAQTQSNGLPTNTKGVLAVRDFLGATVGYLAPPQNNQQGFTFTEDRTNALLATILGDDDGKNAPGNNKHLNVRIALAGGNSFLGGNVVNIPSGRPGSPGGAPSSGGGGGGPSSLGKPSSSGGPSSSNGSPHSGGSPSNGSPHSGGSPSNGSPHSGGPPPSNGAPHSGGPSSSGGPSTEGPSCSSCDPLKGLSAIVAETGAATSIALGLVSAEELSAEEKSLKFKDSVGDAFNLSFLYDIESKQILGQKQVGNSSPQPTNFQYDQGQFCLFDQHRTVEAAHGATGLVNVFFVPA